MCSLSWSRSGGRLIVVMNRDERRDRAPAEPPRRWPGGFTAPGDPDGGGTWIAARDSGVVLALLNHQPGKGVRLRPAPARISRGLLLAGLAAEAGVPTAARLRASGRRGSGPRDAGRHDADPGHAGLARFAPFRLFVAGPSVPPRVFTWNGARLTSRRLDPRVGFLTSSSWTPRRVIPARQARFRSFRQAHPAPTRADLVAFHAQATDARGQAWAICMAREDACTVSTTVVEVPARGAVTMDYRAR